MVGSPCGVGAKVANVNKAGCRALGYRLTGVKDSEGELIAQR